MTDWITVQEAALLIDYTQSHIYYRISKGIYESQKINGRIYVKKDDVFHKEVRGNPEKSKVNQEEWISQLDAGKLMGNSGNSTARLWCKTGKFRTKEHVSITNAKYNLVCKEDILNHMKELDEIQNSDEWITVDEAAKLLNVSHGTIVRRMSLKLYTKRKVNGLNYLNKNEVLTKVLKRGVINPDGYISPIEAAKLIGVSRQAIHYNIKQGKYITKEIDGKIFLSKESVMNTKTKTKKKKNSVSDT